MIHIFHIILPTCSTIPNFSATKTRATVKPPNMTTIIFMITDAWCAVGSQRLQPRIQSSRTTADMVLRAVDMELFWTSFAFALADPHYCRLIFYLKDALNMPETYSPAKTRNISNGFHHEHWHNLVSRSGELKMTPCYRCSVSSYVSWKAQRQWQHHILTLSAILTFNPWCCNTRQVSTVRNNIQRKWEVAWVK